MYVITCIRLCVFQTHPSSGQWNVVFNLQLPGWLPATSGLGPYDEVGIRYSLFATAKFVPVDGPNTPTGWSFSALCSPFRSRTRSINAQKDIVLQRFINPPLMRASPTSAFPCINYSVNARSTPHSPDSDELCFPPEVLDKIRVLVSVPEYNSIDDSELPVTLRIGASDLNEEERKRLQVTAFTIDVSQVEKCRYDQFLQSYSFYSQNLTCIFRYRPSREYLANFPIPPESSQPPNLPLRDPHPISTVYDMGFQVSPSAESSSSSRSFSLFPDEAASTFELADGGYIFGDADADEIDDNNGTNGSKKPMCYTMQMGIPFTHTPQPRQDDPDWAGPAVLRPSAVGPLFSVRHELRVCITCAYDIPQTQPREKVAKKLEFTIPLRFARVAWNDGVSLRSVPPPPSLSSPSSESESEETPLLSDTTVPISMGPCPPYAPSLPAYSQLFDSYGCLKIDYSVPLPLYCLDRAASPSPLARAPDVDVDEARMKMVDLESSIPQVAAIN